MRLAFADALRRLAVAATILLPLPEPAPAEAAVRAVVVGIDTYQDSRYLPPLRGALNDAQDLAETFRGLGVEDLTLIVEQDASGVDHGVFNEDRRFGAHRQGDRVGGA